MLLLRVGNDEKYRGEVDSKRTTFLPNFKKIRLMIQNLLQKGRHRHGDTTYGKKKKRERRLERFQAKQGSHISRLSSVL
jgi:hypothetical protein